MTSDSLIKFLSRGVLFKVIVGFPILLVFLCLICGGVEGAGQVLLLSIICTAGIGLVFWLFVAFILGLLLLKILKAFSKASGGEQSRLDPDIESIKKYITDARTYGFGDSEIRVNLVSAGWGEDKITSAFR